MSTPYLGELRTFGFNYAPKGWAMCNGQVLGISQYAALFALLGTTYGGNGTSNFQLPNLQGYATAGVGSSYVQGSTQGEINHTLLATETPLHTHLFNASSVTGTVTSPVNAYPAANAGNPYTASVTSGVTIASTPAGGSQAHSNQSPYLVLNVCIALVGIFPSRN